MARPTKQGIDYFPMDVDFDDSLEMYLLETGSKGFSVIVNTWALIYRNEGYYIKFNNDLCLLIRKRIPDLDLDSIKDCLNAAIARGIFDQGLAKKSFILTSKGIQTRYFSAAKQKKEIRFKPEFLLIDVSPYDNLIKLLDNSVISPENSLNVNVNVKENVKGKGRGININQNLFEFPAELDYPEFRETWAEWEQYRKKIKKPLTEISRKKQINQLLQEFAPDDPVKILNQSMAAGWQGLFPLKNNNGFNGNNNQSRKSNYVTASETAAELSLIYNQK